MNALTQRDEYTGEPLPSAGGPQPPTSDGTEKAKIDDHLYVVDTTALPGQPPRVHDMYDGKLLKPFEFKAGAPTRLPFAVAIKFLRISAFKRTDEHGNLLPYSRQPKQPEELGAGEKLEIADNQTVARYTELSTMALVQRALELPGGEVVIATKDRDRMIDFIIEQKKKKRVANLEQRPTRQIVGPAPGEDDDEFFPAAEPDTGDVYSADAD
jgi:hypothetical protein